jgi:hypothetical protein
MSNYVQIKHKKTALSNFDKEIFSNIAKDLGIKDKDVEDIVVLFFYCLKESMKRGCNFDLLLLRGDIYYHAAKMLRKQRMGDQKKVIKCIRYGDAISKERMQTILLINKLKKQYEQDCKRND